MEKVQRWCKTLMPWGMPISKPIQMITGAQGGMKTGIPWGTVWNQSIRKLLGCMEGAQRGSRGDAELEWHFGGDKGGRGMHGVG